MEHRNGLRLPVDLDVCIYKGQKNLGLFRASDIGFGGMRFENINLTLCVGDFVSVRVTTIEAACAQQYEMKAMVVHQNPKRVGLMWAGYDAAFPGFFQELISIAA